jgi:DNA-binding winged helix-turn-helix (wHTH) protein
MSSLYIKLANNLIQKQIVEYLQLYTSINNVGILEDSSILETNDLIIVDNDSYKLLSLTPLQQANTILINDEENMGGAFITINPPFKIDALLTAIKQSFAKQKNNLSIGNFHLKEEINKGYFLADNVNIELTAKEYLLLKSLFQAYPNSIDKSTLLITVWNINNEKVETNTIETHISSLRKKLINLAQQIIISKDNAGYKIELIV